MNKKIIMMIATIVISMIFFAGCSNSLFMPYEYEEGITMVFETSEDKYLLTYEIIVDKNSMHHQSSMYNTIYETLHSIYGDDLEEKLTEEDNYYSEGDNHYLFSYMIASTKDFFEQPETKEIPGIAASKRDYKVANPLLSNYMLNATCAVLRNIGGINIESGYGLLKSAPTSRGEVEGGELVVYGGSHFYKWSFDDLSDAPHTLSYSIKYLVSYFWQGMILLLTAITVILILLIAKKKEGEFINLATAKVNPFYPYDGGSVNINPNVQVFPGFDTKQGGKDVEVFPGFDDKKQ